MTRKYTEKSTSTQNELEKEILLKIKDNKTKEKTFDDGIFVDSGTNELIGFYTYRGTVCILDSTMMDIDFNNYSEKDQKIIYDAIMNNKYS